MNKMKKTIAPLFMALAFATSVFAQEEVATEATEQQAAVEEPVAEPQTVAEEPKAEEKKSAFHMDKRPDPAWGIRAGAHLAGIRGQTLSFGYHLGAAFYPVKVFDASLGGDILGIKMFLEPNVLFVSKSGWEGTHQYWLEVPVNANFMFTVFSFRFKCSVGPYLAAGLFGDFDKVEIIDNILAGNKETSKVGRLDVGANATLGYELAKNLWSDVSLGLGFINMVEKAKESSNNFIIKATIGYDF